MQIEEQCWFAENLRSENYENEAIPVDLNDNLWNIRALALWQFTENPSMLKFTAVCTTGLQWTTPVVSVPAAGTCLMENGLRWRFSRDGEAEATAQAGEARTKGLK